MTDGAAPLKGVRVLVTRPAHQAEALCRMIEAEGGTAIRLPLLGIEPAAEPAALQSRFAAESGFWIFTSANAVRHALPLIRGQWTAPVVAVGPATAAALGAAGAEQVLTHAGGASSESVLELPELQSLAGRRVLIVTGIGGRELLERELAARGAAVERAEVYRRVPLPYPPDAVAAALRRSDVIVVTSGEALEHLVHLTPEECRRPLLRKPLVVPGARVVEKARDLGFVRSPDVAEPVSDSAICAAICAARARRPVSQS